MNADMKNFYCSPACRFPQANRPTQGRGHWRTPVTRYRYLEPK